MTRLFLATFLDQDTRNLVSQFQDKHRLVLEEKLGCPVKSCAPESLHLTWKFIGEVENSSIPAITDGLKTSLSNFQASPKRLELEFNQFELWPNLKRPRVAVAKSTQVDESIIEISNLVNASTKEFCQSDSLSFKPHITIFRVRAPRGKGSKSSINHDLREYVEILARNWKSIEIQLDCVHLVKSDLSSGKPIYKTLTTFPI